MNIKVVLVIIAAILPTTEPLRERCDRIELNHFYDSNARLVFDQLLFYEWSHDAGRHQLRAWRMVKGGEASKKRVSQSPMIPRYDHARRCWACEWHDSDIHRRVEAQAFIETWTQYDPELADREFLPKEHRRELRSPATAERRGSK